MSDGHLENTAEADWNPDERPPWRYYSWYGWNMLALAWLILGLLIAFLADLLLSRWLRAHRLLGITVIAASVAVVIADLTCRLRDSEPQGWWRYVSTDAGGCVALLPVWLIALGMAVVGALTYLNLA